MGRKVWGKIRRLEARVAISRYAPKYEAQVVCGRYHGTINYLIFYCSILGGFMHAQLYAQLFFLCVGSFPKRNPSKPPVVFQARILRWRLLAKEMLCAVWLDHIASISL